MGRRGLRRRDRASSGARVSLISQAPRRSRATKGLFKNKLITLHEKFGDPIQIHRRGAENAEASQRKEERRKSSFSLFLSARPLRSPRLCGEVSLVSENDQFIFEQSLSVSLASQASEMKSIQELQIWMADNLHRELSVQALAERVAMRVRNFERVFTREVGSAPSRYVAQLRVEAARRQLAQTEKSIDQIAASCGFGSADLMRRAFVRTLGVTPTRYRKSVVSVR